jgi:acyl dehydratase
MLTLAAATGLMTLHPTAVQAFYGMDKVRFLGPVVFGDTIQVKTEIVEKVPSAEGGGRVDVGVTVSNQRGQPVLATTMKFVVGARP